MKWVEKILQIQKGYTGLVANRYGWWYVKTGKIDFTYSGTYKDESGTYTIVNEKVTRKNQITVFNITKIAVLRVFWKSQFLYLNKDNNGDNK